MYRHEIKYRPIRVLLDYALCDGDARCHGSIEDGQASFGVGCHQAIGGQVI